MQEIREFLAVRNEQADLTSHIVSWKKQANEIIDAALKAKTPETPQEEVIPSGRIIHQAGRVRWRITSAEAEIGGQTVSLDPQAVEPLMAQLLNRVDVREGGEQAEVSIRIVISSGSEG